MRIAFPPLKRRRSTTAQPQARPSDLQWEDMKVPCKQQKEARERERDKSDERSRWGSERQRQEHRQERQRQDRGGWGSERERDG
jgi:hypothetical protein